MLCTTSNGMKKLPLIILGILIIVATFLAVRNKNTPSLVETTSSPSASPGLSDIIQIDKPISNQAIKSPLLVTGKARGSWYFEASFPVQIYDANSVQLAAVPAQAQGDWMTEDFVPFKATLEFKKPTTATGTLVLKKDNPSGLPENDAEFRLLINFDLANWPENTVSTGACKVTGCSGQICSDEEVVTTCEICCPPLYRVTMAPVSFSSFASTFPSTGIVQAAVCT